MANSQVKMLDGLIAMLELIVAMEDLGDIDINGNGIEFDELFELKDDGTRDYTKFNEAYTNWIAGLKE